jgi:hypothetical protein
MQLFWFREKWAKRLRIYIRKVDWSAGNSLIYCIYLANSLSSFHSLLQKVMFLYSSSVDIGLLVGVLVVVVLVVVALEVVVVGLVVVVGNF